MHRIVTPLKLAIASPSGFAHLIESVGIVADESRNQPELNHDMQLAGRVMSELGDTIVGPLGARP